MLARSPEAKSSASVRLSPNVADVPIHDGAESDTLQGMRGMTKGAVVAGVAVLAFVLAGFLAPVVACNDGARLRPFPTGEHPTGIAGQLTGAGEELLVCGYSVDDVTPTTASLTARSWWCLPLARFAVSADGSGRRQ